MIAIWHTRRKVVGLVCSCALYFAVVDVLVPSAEEFWY
jgi:hypothetical protein